MKTKIICSASKYRIADKNSTLKKTLFWQKEKNPLLYGKKIDYSLYYKPEKENFSTVFRFVFIFLRQNKFFCFSVFIKIL